MTISTLTFTRVNTGASANDGTGDSLRAAFVKVNQNYANIEDVGFDAANIRVSKFIEVANLLVSGGISIGNLTPLTYPNALINAVTSANTYSQINIQNTSSGTNSSADFIATSSDGNDTSKYIDLGINGANFSLSTWTMSGAGDGYLYVNTNNLTVGTDTPGTSVKMHVGGTQSANVVTVFNESIVQITSNLQVFGTKTLKSTDESGVNTSSRTLDLNVGGDELVYLNINTNVAIGYSATIVAGRQVDLTIKNTSGGLLYAHLPNANTNKASGNIQIADQSWARLVFTAFGTTQANVVVAVSNN